MDSETILKKNFCLRCGSPSPCGCSKPTDISITSKSHDEDSKSHDEEISKLKNRIKELEQCLDNWITKPYIFHFCGPERKIRPYQWLLCSCCPPKYQSDDNNFDAVNKIKELLAKCPT